MTFGALTKIREELGLSVLESIRSPERFKALGIPLPAGVVLYGPPELLVKYVGESELAVLSVFQRACSSSPCIVFFDELDSVCPKRGKGDGGGGGVSERVVNSLLSKWMGWKVDAASF